MIPYEMKRIKDICTFIGGSQPPKSEFIHEPKEGYVRLIQIRDRLNDNFITFVPKDSVKKFCKKEDILIGRYGPPIFQIFRGFEGAYNVAIMKASPINDVDNDYLYYFLLKKDILDYVESMSARTAGQTGVELDSLYEYPVKLPSKEYQIRFASILKAIDNKISNNNRINAEIESMIKTIYDYWFTQFDFPDENGKPYCASGGKMMWSDELNRLIPINWKSTTIKRYVGRITNGLNPRNNFTLGSGDNYYVTIKSLGDNDINWSACDKCDDAALKKINARSQLKVGDIIFSAIGTIGKTYLIQDSPDNWNISETSFTIRAAENVPHCFMYALLNSLEIQKQADKVAMGSTLRCLVMDSFCNIPTVDVPTEIMNRFSNVVSPMYKKIYQCKKENRELISLRDWLLPLLMNGQVTISD